MTSSHTIRTTAAAALLALAMSAPALAQQDLRSPDTRDAATAATHKQDLRSPDARDAGDLRRYLGTSSLAGTASPPSADESVPASSGFDWLSAAIGAIAAAGLALVSFTAVRMRRTVRA
jgi:hypothetical protein